MITETDGIILRQTNIANDRKMLVILTRSFGKISAGTGIRSSGKRKTSLPLRPFTHGRYELYHGRSMYNVDAADTIESFFEIGENIDSFFCGSCALEFTDKALMENMPAEQVLDSLISLLRILTVRKTGLPSLLLIYQWKILQLLGFMPGLDTCVKCGSGDDAAGLSIADGGVICGSCRNSGTVNMRLLYDLKFDIIRTLKFIEKNEMEVFSRLTFSEDTLKYLNEILKEYILYHLDIKELKSEGYIAF